MEVHHLVQIEVLQLFVNGHARLFQSAQQVHGVGIAGFQVAAGIGVGSVGSHAEQGHLLAGGQRQHAVVVLHDHGTFLALTDADVLGCGSHVLDGVVVLLEPAALAGRRHIAFNAQEVVQVGPVGLCDLRSHNGQHQKHCRHCGKAFHDRG